MSNWSKAITQKTFVNGRGTRIAINAPRGLEEGNEGTWKTALSDIEGTEVTVIDSVEKAFMFSENLLKLVKGEGSKYYNLGEAFDLYSEVICADENGIDADMVRTHLIHWVKSVYTMSEATVDSEAVNVTGKRVSDFLGLIGRVKRGSHYGKNALMVTGNIEVTVKSEKAFIKALCDWTFAVCQMKYRVEPHLVIG